MHSQNLKIKNQFSIIFIQSITEKKKSKLFIHTEKYKTLFTHSYKPIKDLPHSSLFTKASNATHTTKTQKS